MNITYYRPNSLAVCNLKHYTDLQTFVRVDTEVLLTD